MGALEVAVEHGEYVIGELAGTNHSPRLKEAFQQLQTTMVGYTNIVQIGSRAKICNRLVHGSTEELSPTMFSLLIGHIESVFSALAQFEDWRIYSENAAAVNIDAGSVEKLTHGTAELVKHLRREPTADLSAIDALDTASRWIQDGDTPTREMCLASAVLGRTFGQSFLRSFSDLDATLSLRVERRSRQRYYQRFLSPRQAWFQ